MARSRNNGEGGILDAVLNAAGAGGKAALAELVAQAKELGLNPADAQKIAVPLAIASLLRIAGATERIADAAERLADAAELEDDDDDQDDDDGR